MNPIEVKVIRVPGTVTVVGLNAGATVQDALTAANMNVGANEAVSLNGATVSMDAQVSDGARIIIAAAAKGNS